MLQAAASCTLGVLSQSGKRVGTHVVGIHVVETSAKSLIALLDTIPGRKYVCLEEGTMAGWLYEVLSPHVEEVVVAGVDKPRLTPGEKEDYFHHFLENRPSGKIDMRVVEIGCNRRWTPDSTHLRSPQQARRLARAIPSRTAGTARSGSLPAITLPLCQRSSSGVPPNHELLGLVGRFG